jgi:hypothetical protein
LAAVIRHSCTTKLPISNTVFKRRFNHERASALRRETAHCRSLISHSRPAVSASCAAGLGGLCSWSEKYPPLTFATSGEVASHTRVSAPFSGLRDTGLRIVIPKSISRPLLRLNPVATLLARGTGRAETGMGAHLSVAYEDVGRQIASDFVGFSYESAILAAGKTRRAHPA